MNGKFSKLIDEAILIAAVLIAMTGLFMRGEADPAHTAGRNAESGRTTTRATAAQIEDSRSQCKLLMSTMFDGRHLVLDDGQVESGNGSIIFLARDQSRPRELAALFIDLKALPKSKSISFETVSGNKLPILVSSRGLYAVDIPSGQEPMIRIKADGLVFDTLDLSGKARSEPKEMP